MAKVLGIKVAEAQKLQSFVEDVSPLDRLESTDEDMGRGIPESLEPRRIDEAVVQIEIDQQLEQLMAQLTGREAEIMRYRYGLTDGQAHTLEETGKQFGLTRERIRQIEKDVMRRLRFFVAEHAEDFMP